jgi:hypothetical protein
MLLWSVPRSLAGISSAVDKDGGACPRRDRVVDEGTWFEVRAGNSGLAMDPQTFRGSNIQLYGLYILLL